MCRELSNRPKTRETKPLSQLRSSFLNQHPVDTLLVDEGGGEMRADLLPLLQRTRDPTRPRTVVIAGPQERLLESQSRENTKRRRKQMERMGYQSVEWLLHGTEHGGAVDQSRLVEVFYRKPMAAWPSPVMPPVSELPLRDMSNLLLPVGIPRRDWAPLPAIR